MTTPVLEPCPGCGETEWLRVVNAGFKTYEVGCAGDDGCGFRGPKISSDDDELAKQGAREAWNTRVAPRRPSPADQRTAREVAGDILVALGISTRHTRARELVADIIEADRASRPAAPVPPSPVTQLCGVCHAGLIPPGGICSVCVVAAPVPGEPRGDESRAAYGRQPDKREKGTP